MGPRCLFTHSRPRTQTQLLADVGPIPAAFKEMHVDVGQKIGRLRTAMLADVGRVWRQALGSEARTRLDSTGVGPVWEHAARATHAWAPCCIATSAALIASEDTAPDRVPVSVFRRTSPRYPPGDTSGACAVGMRMAAAGYVPRAKDPHEVGEGGGENKTVIAFKFARA